MSAATNLARRAEARTRPGLALVLALLGIPGCTIAWSLPGGGLWIGVPLSLAAIVLGVRHLRGPDRSRRGIATAAIALAAAELLLMAAWTVAG